MALTGVEAVSDGVPAFKPPEWKNARTTLTWAAIIFAILFVGIAYLVTSIHIVPDPSEEQTVLSQLVRHLTGEGADPRGGAGGNGAPARPGGEHELRRLPAPLLLPCARWLPPAPVRLPRRAARLHDRDRRALADGDRPARRLQGQRGWPHPALHARRLPGLHPLAVRHARALVATPGAGLAARARDQRPGSSHHRRGGPRGRDEQLLPGLVAGDRPRPAPHAAAARDPRPLPEDRPRAGPGSHSREGGGRPRDRS